MSVVTFQPANAFAETSAPQSVVRHGGSAPTGSQTIDLTDDKCLYIPFDKVDNGALKMSSKSQGIPSNSVLQVLYDREESAVATATRLDYALVDQAYEYVLDQLKEAIADSSQDPQTRVLVVDVEPFGLNCGEGVLLHAKVTYNSQMCFLDGLMRLAGVEPDGDLAMGDRPCSLLIFQLGAPLGELPEFQQKIQDGVEAALMWVTPEMTPVQKAKALHDYLCMTCTYGGLNNGGWGPYGAFVDKTCVCHGYTRAYGMLLERVGIPSMIVVTEDHGWNLVQLDGQWYHVDVTNDDTFFGTSTAYFLLSTQDLIQAGSGIHANFKPDNVEIAPASYPRTTDVLTTYVGPNGETWSDETSAEAGEDQSEESGQSGKVDKDQSEESNQSEEAGAKTSIAKAKVAVGAKTYTGKRLKASSIKVTLGGKTLKKGRDYLVVSSPFRKAVGRSTVKIRGIGNYEGTAAGAFTVKPKGTNVTKVAKGKKALTVTWKKRKAQTSGYQIVCSTNKAFKKGVKIKTVKISDSAGKKCSLKITNLKSGKKYYVKVRTYKRVKIGGKQVKIYSSWSKTKTVVIPK